MDRQRRAVVAVAGAVGLSLGVGISGCGFMQGVGKTTAEAARTTGRIVTWPVRALAGTSKAGGSKAAGSGAGAEPGTVVVGARPVEEGRGARSSGSRGTGRSERLGGERGSEIYLDGVRVEGPTRVATSPTDDDWR
ncbi:MAG: hypothetical protein KatS3mg108_0302 [Isosphaeraceae bacterium]|jgi:hypothetical protein|nr:MAG: hypothetical protein KatS3mg108_0302 [Isosphaeraceae bacterium]